MRSPRYKSFTVFAVSCALLAGVIPAQRGRRMRGARLERPLRWRCIGPANMMGRIASIDALDEDHRTVLVASASGGVFLSRNAGTTWRAIFDGYGAGSIGAAVFCQEDPSVIWVGTGEAANRNSSGWGDGVYRSTDGGRTFRNMGLADTHHIAEIAIDPRDANVVYVASPGHLWGYSGSRGLFKTTDGGKSWTKLAGGLPDDGKTGCTEVILDPQNPDVVYAGMYHRLRQPSSMYSGGKNGGIFKSTDGGTTWRKLTNGLPAGATGMIDISIHRKNPKIVVANVEADEKLPQDLSVPGPGVYRSDDAGATWRYLLRHNTRPMYHGQIEIDPQDPNRIYVVSRDFRVSTDGGASWRPKWWGGGGDDHDMWISPKDSRIWFNATDQGAYMTVDGGRTLTGFDNMAIGQYYAIQVDMRDPYWVIGGLQDNGLWIGPSNSRERRGILNMHNTWVGEGDGFHCAVDPTDWRTLYMVNHVGFLAGVDLETREPRFLTPTPETIVNFSDWFDPKHPDEPIRYTISPGEHWFFGRSSGRPKLPPQFRFNWSSPMILSKHNPRVLYFGSNHLFKSIDRGETWRIVSPDLTTDDPKLRRPSDQGGLTRNVTGGENHCTIITIGESPIDPACVWCGTDDGNLQVTRNGGVSWKDVRPNVTGVPAGTWVSRVEPSRFRAGRCYVTFDGHRKDDMKPYVFVTEDFGKSWKNLTGDLPDGSVYVVREDTRNEELLFVGSEFHVHYSLERGGKWVRMRHGLPTVAIHDLVIHPRDGDLIAGTHGRSIWICDDITPLQEAKAHVRERQLHLFEPRVATKWVRVNLGRKQPHSLFRGDNPPPGALIHFWLGAGPKRRVTIEVHEIAGESRWQTTVEAGRGMHRVRWPLTFAPSRSQLRDAQSRLLDATLWLHEQRLDKRLDDRLVHLNVELQGAERLRTLNRLRDRLVREFGMYAAGRAIFGKPLGSIPAPAGTYLLRVTVGDDVQERKLVVRDDPLKARGSSGSRASRAGR